MHVQNTVVAHAPERESTEALATPGGGPQINTCTNLTVVNHTASGTGDDALGLFHIRGAAVVTGARIRDSFARGILLCDVEDDFAVQVKSPSADNQVVRCPIYRPDKSACS